MAETPQGFTAQNADIPSRLAKGTEKEVKFKRRSVPICTCGHSKQAHKGGQCFLCGTRHGFKPSGQTREVSKPREVDNYDEGYRR